MQRFKTAAAHQFSSFTNMMNKDKDLGNIQQGGILDFWQYTTVRSIYI